MWNEIRKGNYVFDYSDRGRFILIAPFNETTAYLEYSSNNGLNWTKLDLPQPTQVISILADP